MNFQDELQIELRKVTDCYASLSHSDLGISENEHRLHGEHLSRIIFLLNKNSHKFDRNQIFFILSDSQFYLNGLSATKRIRFVPKHTTEDLSANYRAYEECMEVLRTVGKKTFHINKHIWKVNPTAGDGSGL